MSFHSEFSNFSNFFPLVHFVSIHQRSLARRVRVNVATALTLRNRDYGYQLVAIPVEAARANERKIPWEVPRLAGNRRQRRVLTVCCWCSQGG